MYTRVKTAREIANMRVGGKILAEILQEIRQTAKVGVTGQEIDELVAKKTKAANATCAFKGFNGYPAHICVSINDVVVHGIPDKTPFKKGDVVTFDFGIIYGGMVTDSAFTMVIGESPASGKKRLLEACETALHAGLDEVKNDVPIGTISAAIETVLRGAKLGIFRELVGHGVGHSVHEQPDIPNYGRQGQGPLLKKGMTVAIEPMASLGLQANIETDKDGWAIRTIDGSLAAQFEHTVLVTEGGCEILTKV